MLLPHPRRSHLLVLIPLVLLVLFGLPSLIDYVELHIGKHRADGRETFSYGVQRDWRGRRWVGGPHPYKQRPSYERIIQTEKALPQHNLSLPYPEGKNGKYVIFRNQVRALGWNNVFNEILLSHHVAYRAGRSYIFQDYEWKSELYPWRIPANPPPRNPLSTLIAGPTVGGPFEAGDPAPRAVREDWWTVVCGKKSDIERIDSNIGKGPVFWSDGQTIADHWVKLLQNSPKRCVEVIPSRKDSHPQTFDLWMIGDGRLLTIWEEFRRSPISRLLAASPLVQSAIDQNLHLFYPPERKSDLNYDPFQQMMAVHIRRGDYINACIGFAQWNSTFYGWNLLPELLDPFTAPPNQFKSPKAPEDHIDFYLRRCLPTNEYLLAKIEDSRAAWEAKMGNGVKLEILFVMTNAEQDWIDEFKSSLIRLGKRPWKNIVSTKELVLDVEQTGVNMAVDMEIGRKASVYIGNGWSSMSSNILHRRLVDDKKPLSNRFW